MKSLHIGLRWSNEAAGGVERIFEDLAAELPGTGIGFTGAVPGPPDLNVQTGGRLHAFAPEHAGILARLWGARVTINRLLDELKPDILASHFAYYTAPILPRLRERPFFVHFHGPWALESQVEGASKLSTSMKRMLERSVYSRAHRIIVLSEAFALLLRQEYGIGEDRIRVVPGAVDLERFAPTLNRQAARESLGWPSDRTTLFCVRRLVHRMGIDQLIDALSEVRNSVPDVLLYLGGTGPMRQALEQRARERGVEEAVRFLGFIPDAHLPLAFRAANLSVVPSGALEGFGLVAAESLAAGTPAMVTPVGGLPEVVRGLSDDLIFRSGRAPDLAAAIVEALLGKRRIPDDAACRSYAEKRFSRKTMAARIAAVYQEG